MLKNACQKDVSKRICQADVSKLGENVYVREFSSSRTAGISVIGTYGTVGGKSMNSMSEKDL